MSEELVSKNNYSKAVSNEPLISVIMNCYNSSHYLRDAIESVLNQTYPNWEIIFWDNNSADESASIFNKYTDQRLRYFLSYEHTPLGRARNLAIEKAKGDWLAFLDCDDLWMPQKLEKQMTLFNDPEVGLVYSDAIYFNEDGDSSRFYGSRNYYTGKCFRQLLTDYFLCMQTVVLRKAALYSLTQWFDPEFNMSEDADLFTRIGYKWKLLMVNEPLAKWRVHSLSQTWTLGKGVQFANELDAMLVKFENVIPDFNIDYSNEISFLRKNNVIMRAMFMWRDGKNKEARRILLPLLKRSIKAWFILAVIFFPERLVRRLLTPVRKTKISPSR